MIAVMMVVLAVVVAVLAFYFRNSIANVAQGLVADIQVMYLDFGTIVWPAIRATVFFAFCLSLIPWLIFAIAMNLLGHHTNSPDSAWVIIILFPFWFPAFIMPEIANRIYFFGPVIKVLKGKIVTSVLVIAFACLVFGLLFPEVKGSYNNWSNSRQHLTAVSIDKSANENLLEAKAKVGVIGFLREDTSLYDGLKIIGSAKKGEMVKVIIVAGKPVGNSDSQYSEDMVTVTFRNKSGQFVGGDTGDVPSRIITLNQNG